MARFFISYARPDLVWAEWIDTHLKSTGHTTVLQARDFRPGSRVIKNIDNAIRSSDRVLAVISPAYSPNDLESDYTSIEWEAALKLGKLIGVRVQNVDLDGVLSTIDYIDLADLDETTAGNKLILEVARALERPPCRFRERPAAVSPSPAPLNAEIQNQRLDTQIPERSALLPSGSRMALPTPPRFVDRRDPLRKLATLLHVASTTDRDRVPTVVLTGPPGIGKTYLAQEFVYRYGRYFGGGVFWLDFTNKDAAYSEIAACGLECLSDKTSFEKMTTDRQSKEVTKLWRGSDARLLVFDNCSEPEHLKELLPPHGGCSVLVTSRKTDWGGELVLDLLEVPPLERGDSLDLIRSYRGFPLTEESVLTKLAEELGDHPQALHSAAIYITNLRVPVSYFLRRMQQDGVTGQEGLKQLSWAIEDLLRQLDAEENEPEGFAVELLSAAARISPGLPIPHQLLLDFANIQQESLHIQGVAALRQLDGKGLVQFNKYTIFIDRLIAQIVREHEDRHDKEADQENARQRFDRKMSNFLQRKIHDWNEPVSTEQPNAERNLIVDIIIQREEFETPQFAALLHSLGRKLMSNNFLSTARRFFQRAISIWERRSDPDDPSAPAQGMQSLGELLERQADYPGARVCYERALEVRRQVLDSLDPLLVQTINSLGILSKKQGDLESAQSHYEAALEIQRQALERHPEDAPTLQPEVAHTLNNLGVLARETQELERARKFHEEALKIRETFLAQSHPDRAQSLRHLGALLVSLGDLEKAQTYFERALLLRKVYFRSEDPDVADTLYWMGYLLERKGDLNGATEHYENARAIYEERLGSSNPRTTRIMQKLAEVRRHLDR